MGKRGVKKLNQSLQILQEKKWLPIKMILYGILVGIAASVVTVVYRFMLQYAESVLFDVIGFTKGNLAYMTLWCICLLILAYAVSRIVAWEGMCSGSGIPQVQGELKGYFDVNWWKLLVSKMVGGTLCIIGGLSLGREGPSVQLGAMAGKGLAKVTKQNKTKERYMITCGAGAGLAAAFNAPIAGVVFALEEIQKNFNSSMLVCVLSGCVTADFISKNAFGLSPVFHFDVPDVIPLKYYGFLIIFGAVLGLTGILYSTLLLKGQDFYGKLKKIRPEIRMMIPFLCAGILAYILPNVLAGGHAMIELVYEQCPAMSVLILLLIVKSLFSAISFGSSAPGGIFFPLLIAGAYVGAIYGSAVCGIFGISKVYLASFIILGMAGFFTAIVRAPITGIILIAEMTGGFEHLLPLAVVSIISYMIAHITEVEPIYESLLERNIIKAGKSENNPDKDGMVLLSFIIGTDSIARDEMLANLPWPEHSVIAGLRRGPLEIVPRGDTMIRSGDTLIVVAEKEYLKMIVDAYQIISGEVEVDIPL
jgi:H+/Cl- antiporter ClcA